MIRSSRLASCVGGTLTMALLVGRADAAVGQAQVEFIPYFASYYALVNTGLQLSDPSAPSVAIGERHANVAAVGAALGVRVGPVLGFEVGATVAPSGTRIGVENAEDRSTASFNAEFSGTVIMGAGLIRLQAPRTNFYGLFGVSVVRRGGNAWEGFSNSDLTDIGGVVGAAIRAQVAPGFAVDVRVEAYLYQFDPDGSDFTIYDATFTPDVLVKLGIPIGRQ